jgi:hypothetical protein
VAGPGSDHNEPSPPTPLSTVHRLARGSGRKINFFCSEQRVEESHEIGHDNRVELDADGPDERPPPDRARQGAAPPPTALVPRPLVAINDEAIAAPEAASLTRMHRRGGGRSIRRGASGGARSPCSFAAIDTFDAFDAFDAS